MTHAAEPPDPILTQGLPLPDGWVAGPARVQDAPDLHALLVRHETAARGGSGTGPAEVAAVLTGAAAEVRHHLVLRDVAGTPRAWFTAHDRAAGRVLVAVVVDSDLPPEVADAVAAAGYDWVASAAQVIGAERGLARTQVDTGAFADDERQQRWLSAAGFTHVRTWWQMSRPVTDADAAEGAFPAPHPSVRVRRVRREMAGAMPDQEDLQAVHDVLEEAFADHFNHHEESFDEFLLRLREDPGHRWDHWWLAELVGDDGRRRPAGALVGAVVLPADPEAGPAGAVGAVGSYVEYLGVLRSARGRGVARSLLAAVVVDAAERGRDRVGLEVDADSPTGADALYVSMGFETRYVTHSWNKDVEVR